MTSTQEQIDWNNLPPAPFDGPTSPGVYFNKQKSRVEYWRSGPYGLYMKGWIRDAEPAENKKSWLEWVETN